MNTACQLARRLNFIDPKASVQGKGYGPGVVVIGDVTIGKRVLIGDNTLIQAFPGRTLVLDGQMTIGKNCTIQARKSDLHIVNSDPGTWIQIRRGAFIKDVIIQQVKHCDIGPYAEVKELTMNGGNLVVGKRAFVKKVNLSAGVSMEVPPLTRVDGESIRLGTDIFTLSDKAPARHIKGMAQEQARACANVGWRTEAALLELCSQGVELLSPEVCIGREALVGQGTTIYPGVTLAGQVIIGERNILYPDVHLLAVAGHELKIGNGNTFFPGTYIIARERGGVIGNDCSEIGIGGGATVVDSTLGDRVILVGHPVVAKSTLKGDNRVFRSLIETSVLAAGSPDDEVEVKTGCVVSGALIEETISENTRRF